MAAGTKTDFVIYQEEFWGGMSEVLQQNTEGFNAASNNAIRLVSRRLIGDYEKESFFKELTNVVARRDVTSVSSVADTALTQGEHIGVKINRRIGPFAQTLDAFRKIGDNPSEASFLLGQQMAKGIAKDYLDTALTAAVAGLSASATTGLVYNATALTTTERSLRAVHLARGLAKMGDAASRVRCLVMHSKPFFDLMENHITEKVFEVAGAVIYGGSVPTLGKPVIVTDSAALVTDATVDSYHVLGLVEDAIEVAESEDRNIVSDTVTGLENLVIRIQGEHAFNLKLKGMSWNTTSGVNPTNAAIGTSTNWTKVATDLKSLPGFRIVVQ